MNSNYIISKQEQNDYEMTGKISSRLNQIWFDLVKKLPTDMRKDALNNHFKLKMHPLNDPDHMNNISYNLMFDLPNANIDLQKRLEHLDDNMIICMQDPI
jgi:hypothetical protein